MQAVNFPFHAIHSWRAISCEHPDTGRFNVIIHALFDSFSLLHIPYDVGDCTWIGSEMSMG